MHAGDDVVGPLGSRPDGPGVQGVRAGAAVGGRTAPQVVVPTSVLLDALGALAAAGTRLHVVEPVLRGLLDLPGVRAAAVVTRLAGDAVVQGSAGYECGAMAPGQRLPLDAGLPVTEAVRTGRTVVRGPGPAWAAAPFRRRAGAVLLSLDGAPPQDLEPVEVLARAVGDALERVAAAERALADLAGLAAGAACVPDVDPELDARLGVAARSLPRDGTAGGDVLAALPDGRGGSWLVAADVCGSGPAAAVIARSVATGVRALAPHCAGPAALLAELERSLRPVVGPGSFVTALVVHLGSQAALVASAGHPPPLLVGPSGAAAVAVPTGAPLVLEEVAVRLPPGALLLLHTDGLVDRGGAHGTDPLLLLPTDAPDPAVLLEAVVAAAERTGPAVDDAAVMVVRVPPPR